MEKERQESAEIRHGHFLKNFGWLTLGKAGYLLLSFIVTLTVVKYLGPYDFGTINYVDAYVKFAYVIATFGLDAIIVREVATGKHDSNSVVWTATFVRLILGVVLGIGVIGLLFLTDGQDPESETAPRAGRDSGLRDRSCLRRTGRGTRAPSLLRRHSLRFAARAGSRPRDTRRARSGPHDAPAGVLCRFAALCRSPLSTPD